MFDDLLPPPITEADPNAFEDLRASISRAQRIRHFLALDLAEHITQILRERRKSRRWLAQRLGKTDSEVSKWLSGTHNLTLDSIAKLSDALEVDLFVSTRFPMGYFSSAQASMPAKTTATSFDQSGGYQAKKFERLATPSVPQQPAYNVPPAMTDEPQVLAMLRTAQLAGDYSYAMAA